jgi:hypothetical protein
MCSGNDELYNAQSYSMSQQRNKRMARNKLHLVGGKRGSGFWGEGEV